MGRHLCIVSLVLGISTLAVAGVEKEVTPLAPPLAFDRLTSGDGLPNSDIKAIIQDGRGFVWFGTQEGLVRYDGRVMRVYRPIDGDPTSISGGYITALALAEDGKLWIGTAENGVNQYDPLTDKFTRYTKGTTKGSLTGDGVTAIVRDKKNRVWFAMTGGGVDRFDKGEFTAYLTGSTDNTFISLDADATGNLWLGTDADGVMRWNPDTNAAENYRISRDSTSPITAVRVASDGVVWLGSEGDGLAALDPATKKLVIHRHVANDPASISDDHISALFEDRHKNMWIGTTNGLNRIDATGRIVQYHHNANDATSLAFPGVESVFQDAGGVMWIGGFTVGVCKFDELRLKFGHYRTSTQPANSYFEDPDGTLWVGTYNGGLYRYDLEQQRVTLYQTLGKPGEPGSIALGSAWISALQRDRRGILWIALKGQGLIAFDTKAETYKQFLPDPTTPKSLPVDTVWDLWSDDKGDLYLATWGSGLVRLDPQTETFTTITTEETIGSSYLYTLYPDPTDKNFLWIGTAKGGLVRFDLGAKRGTSFRHKAEDLTSLSSDDILSIYRDASGMIWTGTYGGGFDKLDPSTGKAQRFTANNSKLPNDVVFGILPDNDGKLWLSTNGGGLVKFDPKSNAFAIYTASDGIQDNEFGQGSFMRSTTGKLYFGGVGGFNVFSPRDIVADPYIPPVVMTGFKIFNQDVSLPQPIWTLPKLAVSYSDSFEVQFAALSFAAPGKNRYAYKLDGFDDKFIETDRPFATYTKLAGGKYTLRVRAANQHGVWNETGIALAFSVAPPWWRTWPAFLGYIVVLGAIGFVLFRTQQLRVKRIVREGRLAAVERDLALTGAVQSGFLPDYNEIDGALKLYGFYRPADACSGDWWWHEVVGNRHVIMVGDVTGHGPGPAMVTAAVATAFRVVTGAGLGDITQLLELLNRVVVDVAKGKYHMTMAALELDDTTGQWILHSAGAPPILSLDIHGKHQMVFCPGAPLGTENGFEVGQMNGTLAPGERILVYTDGMPEITLANGNVLGMRRFAQMYEGTRNQNLREAATTLVTLADQTRANEPQQDDWTFTIVEWGTNPLQVQ